MKYKKVNSGCFDGSPESMMKPEEVFHSMSPEAVMFRHGIDPCGMIDSGTKPLNLATGGAKIEQQYQCYAPTPTTPTPGVNAMGMGNFAYPAYYNHLASSSTGLEAVVEQHRQQAADSLSMANSYHHKYTNNNVMQYDAQQYNTGIAHYYASQ